VVPSTPIFYLKNSILFIQLGNCDIYFFVFCHRFHIMRPKFPKFERDQNAAQKFLIDIYESEKLQNSAKVDEIII